MEARSIIYCICNAWRQSISTSSQPCGITRDRNVTHVWGVTRFRVSRERIDDLKARRLNISAEDGGMGPSWGQGHVHVDQLGWHGSSIHNRARGYIELVRYSKLMGLVRVPFLLSSAICSFSPWWTMILLLCLKISNFDLPKLACIHNSIYNLECRYIWI
jgi:hypothetical protein